MNSVSPRHKNEPAPGEYVPVKASSLLVNGNIDFDVYLQTKDSSAPVLYSDRNLTLTDVGFTRIHENEIETLYIRASDLPAYRRRIELSLGTLLKRDDISSKERLGILYDSAQGLVSDVFEDPRSGDSIQRSRKMIEHTVAYLLKQGDVLNDLHHVMSYDYHVYTHSVNVCVFGLSLALRSGITDPHTLQDLGSGLLLHDVGKSEIDPEIVNCPGKLTKEQFEEMKMHTIYGYEILSTHADLDPMVLDITRHHHEKLNGHGYPDRLTEERISKFVRISTIVDIFDALTTKRVYKPALKTFDALKLMNTEDLDPEYLRNFVQMLGSTQKAQVQ